MDQGKLVFGSSAPRAKILHLEEAIERARRGRGELCPPIPSRDVTVLPVRELPKKEGLSTLRGQARLLHDIANIELQAMELALRTLIEFHDIDPIFFEELAVLTRDEGRHLAMCLEGLESLGHPWGTWPIHTALWTSVAASDHILDRLLIVHRYQEGGGLDAGETLMRRLNGVVRVDETSVVKSILDVIFREELGHVQFGSRWYRELALREGLDPDRDFKTRLKALMIRMPRRLEPISTELRLRAGFSPAEILALQTFQLEQKEFS